MEPANPSDALKAIAAATSRRADPEPLTAADGAEILVRAGLELVPLGIGAALGQVYWGTQERRWQKKVDGTVAVLCERLTITEHQVQGLREYYSSDGFAALFEGCWRRIRAAAQQRQLDALRGALLSILERRPDFGQGKLESFLGALDRLGDVHIYLMQLYRERLVRGEPGWYLVTHEVFDHLGAAAEADQQYVYSALDTLANLRFVEHGNIPRRGGADGPIDFPNQRFRATTLGAEFLEFVRLPGSGRPSA